MVIWRRRGARGASAPMRTAVPASRRARVACRPSLLRRARDSTQSPTVTVKVPAVPPDAYDYASRRAQIRRRSSPQGWPTREVDP